MTCMTAFAEPMAMATTQLTRVVQDRVFQYENAAPGQLENNDNRIPRMSWVVVTDKQGRQQLRILWRTKR